jgi:phenylpropionate dioxygenase-like ring-hydroxylating dioxygenase large terminal subunit
VVGNDEGCAAQAGNIRCKYHGCTYNFSSEILNVSLSRELDIANRQAQSYEKLSEFDRKESNLFPIHVHISEEGLVFVNLSADPDATPFQAPSIPIVS